MLTVELLGDETITLPLLPSSVTLRDLQVDGRAATILHDGGHDSSAGDAAFTFVPERKY